MKNIIVSCLFLFLLAQVSFAVDHRFGISLDAKTTSYTASIGNYSAANNLDPMCGVGIVLGVPLRDGLALRFEGQYNTASSFTNSLGQKTEISVYPMQVSLQNAAGGMYFGGGINYTLWTSSIGGNSVSENNGIGYQAYAGFDSPLLGNLELKYTYMAASFSFLGSTINQSAGAISLGTKFWII